MKERHRNPHLPALPSRRSPPDGGPGPKAPEAETHRRLFPAGALRPWSRPLSVTFHFFNAFLAAQFVAKVERTTGGIRGTLEKASDEALSLAVLLAAIPEVSRLAAARTGRDC